MKISFNTLPIKQYNTSFQTPAYDKPSFCGVKELTSDIFQINSSPLKSGLSKIHKMTKEEYESLSKKEKKALRNALASGLDNYVQADNLPFHIELHQFAAESIKKVMDKQYGEGNYVVLTIGRSLSSVSKLLAMKIGEENVKNLPMSEMNRFSDGVKNYDDYESILKNFIDGEGVEEYKKWLNSIGLSREIVNTSKKHYILMDYTASGKGLEGAYNILTSDLFLGNDKRNITTASMSQISNAVTDENGFGRELEEELVYCTFKRYSLIGKAYMRFKDAEKISNYENLYKNREYYLNSVKLFGFALMDSEFENKPPFTDKIQVLKNLRTKENSELWKRETTQYKSDLKSDLLEVYKLIKRIPAPFEYDQFLEDAKEELQSYINEGEQDYYSTPSGSYYNIFRPEFLKTMSEIYAKFPPEE